MNIKKTILNLVFLSLISLSATTAYPFLIPDTGQTKCYDNSGEITCPGPGEAYYGQDGNYLINPPSYTKLDSSGNDLPDSATTWVMVRDNVTGLIWEVKTDDGSVHDKDNTYTWYDSNPATNGGNAGTPGNGTDTEDFINALNAENFGSYSDWRLPTIKELQSFMALGRYSSAVDTNFFPSSLSYRYWSSTTRAGSITVAWLINFPYGGDGVIYKNRYNCAPAVRAGQTLPSHRLVTNGDGTVTDIATGLMWQQTTSDSMNWENALSYCENLVLSEYDDWRLPSLMELQTIVDYSKSPAIDTNYFPTTLSSYHWSSTTNVGSNSKAWVVNFGAGDGNNYDKSNGYGVNKYYVRAARAGQPQLLDHLFILTPLQSSTWSAGQSMSITWDTRSIPGNARISISRLGGKSGTFEIITGSTENDGAYEWKVSGPDSFNCALRIEPLSDPTKDITQSLFTIKTVLPTATISGIPPSPVNQTGANLIVSGEGVTQYKFKLNNEDYSVERAVAEQIILSDLNDGSHTVSVIGRDSLENWQSSATTAAWVVDTSAPTAVISGQPASSTNSTSASLTISGMEVTHYKYKQDNGAYSGEISVSTPCNQTGLSDGSYTISVIGRDAAGNWQLEESATTVTWTVDTSEPSVTGLSDDTIPTKSKIWTWDADELATFRYAVDQSATWTATGEFGDVKTTTKSSADGTWYLHVQAKDSAGNEGGVTTVSALLDNTTPTTNVSPVGGLFNTDQSVSLSSNETADIYYTTDGSEPTTASAKYASPIAITTTTTLKFMAVDTAGNQSPVYVETYVMGQQDSDGDGMLDGWEIDNFGDLSHDGTADSDGDGLTDLEEYQNDTNPNESDSDGDGMPDKWEVDNNLDPNVDDAGDDADGDKFTNGREYQDETDPNNSSSHLVFPAVTGRIPDTGQTKCYDNSVEIPCPAPGGDFYGQDGSYTINPPSYTKIDAQGNYLADSATSWVMVRDNVTGLIWEVKTDDGSIHDKDNTYTWYHSNPTTNGGNAGTPGDGTDTEDFINALNAASFGGYSDWRLPTIMELTGLAHLEKLEPAIDTEYFPNTFSSNYWSSTTIANGSDSAWSVDFYYGDDGNNYKSNPYYVHAVRGGQSGSLNHLVINGDGTVTDTYSGLMWQQGTIGPINWNAALEYCENLTLAGYGDWHLPNQKELRSIADYTKRGPAIDTVHFPDTLSSDYWSSTTSANGSGSAWNMYFTSGNDYYYWYKSNANYVRATRGGQNQVAGHLHITNPVQGSKWNVGDSMPITWDSQSISGDVEISISRQGGKSGTFETIIASTENDGAYDWTVTGPISANCALTIEPLTDPSKGTTQSLFTIASTTAPTATILSAPVGATNQTTATLTISGDSIISYKYKLDDGDYGNEILIADQIVLTALTEGTHTVYVLGRDAAGTWQTAPTTATWTVDIQVPTASAAPGGGLYDTGQTVTLSSNETADMYYTTDGSEPTTASAKYASPIAITTTTTLKFMAVDTAGNQSPVYVETYVMGQQDSDGDGMLDGWEIDNFGDLSHDGTADSDGDGLTDLEEYQNDTNPNESDSDGDGMPDKWEVDNNLDPNVDDAGEDADSDKFTNGREYQDQTDPNESSSHLVFPAVTGRIPDTGQTKCYDNSVEISCSEPGGDFYGQDASYTINPPSYMKMDVQGNYLADSATSWAMVRDNVTGLIWEVKTDDGTIHDKDNTYTWYDSNPATNGGDAGTPGAGTDTEDFIAALNAESFGGHTDWRLPTIKELAPIANLGRMAPAIDTEYFPNTVLSYYWSSTTYANGTYLAWRVAFSHGYDYWDGKGGSYYVRAVRGGQSRLLDSLVINGDGTVTDASSGLMWQLAGTESKMTWEAGMSHCEGLSLGGYTDWRLPNREELSSIVDYTRYGLAVDAEYFPNTVSSSYWSSTTFAYSTDNAWLVDFYYGSGYDGSKDYYGLYVRAVRGGQSRLLDSLIISSPAQGLILGIGDTLPITWDTSGITGTVAISISRQGGKDGTFETIIASTENDGSYEWTVTGPISANCALKIEPLSDPSKGTTQSLFTIASTTAPAATISGAPVGATNQTTATLTISGDSIISYKYKLDDGSYGNEILIADQIVLTGLTEGTHTVYVLGRDAAGTWQTEPTTATWTVDTQAPTATISGTPLSPTNQTGATLTVSGEGVTHYKYKLDTGSYSAEIPVSTPIELTGLGNGSHTVSVMGRDITGNWQSVATTATWEVDTLAPAAGISGQPSSPTKVNSATLTVGGEGVTHYQYSVDGGAFGAETAVANPITLTGLLDASHTISVIGRDAAGNWQLEESATAVTWTVDTGAPAVTGLTDDAVPTKSMTWTWDADEPATFRYSVDQSATWIPTGTFEDVKTTTKSGVDGTWYLHVQAKDTAGNEGPIKTVSANLDNTAPTVSASPSGGLFNTGQSVTLSLNETADIYYTTDGSDPTTGSATYISPIAISVTTTLKFMAVDAAGNQSSDYTEVYTIDGDAPDPPVLTPVGSGYINDATPILEWSTVTDAATYAIQYAGNPDFTDATTVTGLTTTSYTIPAALSDGTWYWCVKTIDAASNESPWSNADSFVEDAATHRIPSEYGTIQAGIDFALDGDTVLVSPGTYVENINFNGKNITVGSLLLTTDDLSYISQTVIDGNANGLPVVRFENGETENARLIGFTVQNGFTATEERGGGVNILGESSPTLERLVIQNNISLSSRGGGIRCYYAGVPTIKDVTVKDNTCNDMGGGIYVFESSINLINSIISGNTAPIGSAVSFYGNQGGNPDGSIVNCLISGNIGGVLLDGSDIELRNCTIYGNSSEMNLYGESLITNSIVWGGHTINVGGILGVSYSLIEGGKSNINYPFDASLVWGDGNIDSGPLFVNPANSDYHLRADSPCIDSGTLDGAPSIDIEGTARPAGTSHDMGAYEAYLPVALIPYTPDPTNNAMPTLEWNDVAGAVTYTLHYSGQSDFSAVTEVAGLTESTYTPTSVVSDGSLYWQVRAVGADGISGWWSWTDSFVIDTGASTAVISGRPSSPTNSNSATLTIGGEGVTHYRYKIDEGVYSNEIEVGTPINLTGLDDGIHTVSVIGSDAAGNWQSEDNPTTVTWAVDTAAPSVTGLIDDPVPTQSVTWVWDADEPATFRYAVNQNATWTFDVEAYGGTTTAAKTDGDGTWYLHVQAKDTAGNESAVVTVSGILDNAPPATTVDPPGGVYVSEQTVMLTCDDTSGFECDGTYYTTDGTLPTLESIRYETPVPIGVDTMLKFFSVDTAGNAEPVKTEVYVIDSEDPSITIISPEDGATVKPLYSIEGTSSDEGTGIGLVEVRVLDGTGGYLTSGGQWLPAETWLTASGTTSWDLVTGDGVWDENIAYSITVKATDGAGNKSETSISFTYGDPKDPSTITCDLAETSITLGDPLRVSGQITPTPAKTEEPVNVVLTPPVGPAVYQTTRTNLLGQFQYDIACDDIYRAGTWSVYASWSGDADLEEATSNPQTLEVSKAQSTVTLDVASPIKTGEAVDISVLFVPEPNCGADLSDIPIFLDILDPDNTSVFSKPLDPYNTNGRFMLEQYPGFNAPGEWTVRVSFAGTPAYEALSDPVSVKVTVLETAGYAILINGKIGSEEGLAEHNKTLKFVYNKLRIRGLEPDDIQYLSPYYLSDPEVDGPPTRDAIQNAITVWARDKMNTKPANLYIVMVDHGEVDQFFISPDTITPYDLKVWLGTLEAALAGTPAENQETIVILGFCYAGSFIDELSGTRRVIIASADADELSFRGPVGDKGVHDGEFFVTQLFTALPSGKPIKWLFEKATQATEKYSGSGKPGSNGPPYFDKARQHPLLDDNGDGVGSNDLSDRVTAC